MDRVRHVRPQAPNYLNLLNATLARDAEQSTLGLLPIVQSSTVSMSRLSRGDSLGRASIPPIEIGSFAALHPDKSEFIGSASGVFFVNTVFRAFAAASAGSDTEQPGERSAPDPGSAHSYVATTDNAQTQGLENNSVSNATSIDTGEGVFQARSYGVTCAGLGCPPPVAKVQKLLMRYFRDWHPFFPFLHGPTFWGEVDAFYGPDTNDGGSAHLTSGKRLVRAVTFQCIFNIAASSRNSDELDLASRIHSTTALMELLGNLSTTPDIRSLQALLAVELYLITVMSLRAASTVHGTLVRMLYHTGFHRCPFRFVQLPRSMCDLRKRVFWSAYILDRFLSQALGHPTAIRDDEVDVCTPSMPELHKPVKPREQNSLFEADLGDEVQEHLPTGQSNRRQTATIRIADSNEQDARLEVRKPDIQSPAHHHTIRPEAAGEYVQGYLVTYSRLLGTSLDLLHKSIHKRSITWDKVLEITYQVHAWWNSLPSALQDKSTEDDTDMKAHFGSFFAMLYHYLILLINRPFLSLPAHTVEFQSSLQSALGCGRSILALNLHRGGSSPMAWPGTLSAIWMSGLVIAFSSLLELYPLEKARV